MEQFAIAPEMQRRMQRREPFFSFEFFAPKAVDGMANLFARIERMSVLEPLFVDVTWTRGERSLEVAKVAAQYCGVNVMLHLSLTDMTRAELLQVLAEARKIGIRNILALRGDPRPGQDTWEPVEEGLQHAADLVRLIRQEHGDFFCIGVAAYPEVHLEAPDEESDMKHFLEKVDAGADFVLTQMVFDAQVFFAFRERARASGFDDAKVPLVPGIMPIQSYAQFRRMTGFCRAHVPAHVWSDLAVLQNDDARVKAYGIRFAARLCAQLLRPTGSEEAGVPGVHFFTLNLERSATRIVEKLELVATTPRGAKNKKTTAELPWQMAPSQRRRKQEDVRPIFWANRPLSYIRRTSLWDEYPNGRWGDRSSPAFGDLRSYHLFLSSQSHATPYKAQARRAMWGHSLESEQDLADAFIRFLRAEIPWLPWCEQPVQAETSCISGTLEVLNKAGLLTINSQPAACNVPSDDPAFGWGSPGGYVSQKAYVEFFCSPEMFERIQKLAHEQPSLSYHALSADGVFDETSSGATNAVTWGVFPDSEIVQPTVVDPGSFTAWRDEAFAIWRTHWQSIYPAESQSWRVIQHVHDTYYLVNIVDNDFVHGTLFDSLRRLCADVLGTALSRDD